jgi:CelD/BcsL family acetyltransferase involved in cellulose biosynthesis
VHHTSAETSIAALTTLLPFKQSSSSSSSDHADGINRGSTTSDSVGLVSDASTSGSSTATSATATAATAAASGIEIINDEKMPQQASTKASKLDG